MVISFGPISIALFVAVASALYYIGARFLHARLSCRNLPQPPHSFWFGHILVAAKVSKSYPSNSCIHHLLITISREYNLPDVFYLDLWPFAYPMVILGAPELAAQVTTEQAFPKDPVVNEFLSPFLGKSSIISVNGAKWKALHSIFAPAFSPAYVRTLTDGMVDEVLLYYNKLAKFARSREVFSMSNINVDLTINVIGRVVFDSPFHSKEGHDFVSTFRAGLDYVFEGGHIGRRLLYAIPTWRMVRKVDRYVEKKVITCFDKMKKEGSSVKKSKTILDLVLKQKLDKQEDIVGDRDFMEMAISNIKSFLAAGHETTAHTLGYIFMLLSKHPDALQKARLEHDQVFDPDFKRTVELIRAHPERLYDLHYTTGIIKESLRLFPIGSAARTSAKGLHVMYEGKKLPLTDQIILVCNMIIHYNPEIFPSPGDFQPERFTTQIVPKDAWRPFERGLRRCIGQDLAMMEMRMVLLIVLRSFDFETLGTNERKYPAATYTNLHTIFGDLVYQRQSLTARPLGNQDMKVKFARDMRNS
ncbi:uncharacterized protein PADG_07221 [Paracoccidioides brasiliensis Pb18]|uniref:Cytochrome P450 n=1 Tax=Paracoccidioides brasiliensis (strain Pb18) TaxID=502780 RepID=C1GIY5_PARBD|nr:uncharacterized protein PADG_07221 [Paracoccidioides brasiliensis Pb18]EEH42401.2 hypothetical protein PADG_07221 [Paracoccidioides brasiliensis Pb18]